MDCPNWMQEVWANPNLVAVVEEGSIEGNKDTPKAIKRCSEVVLEYAIDMPGYGKYSTVYVDELIHRFREEVAYQELRITHVYFIESFIEEGQLKYKYKVLLDNGDFCILTRNNKL
jgi:hypothetical protein